MVPCHLRCFLAVAKELLFARAAEERLHIEQLPLSRIINKPEENLGGQLFIRTSISAMCSIVHSSLVAKVTRACTACCPSLGALSCSGGAIPSTARDWLTIFPLLEHWLPVSAAWIGCKRKMR